MKTKAIFYINIIAFTFLSGYMSSCTEKCYDHFIFFYHHGFIDRNHAIGIKDYEKDCDKSAFTDTIYMSRNLFDTINSEIQKSTETDTGRFPLPEFLSFYRRWMPSKRKKHEIL